MLDAAVGSLGLVASSPFLAVAALAIKLEDGGPILYRQTRVGRDGVDFELLKLRTMVVGAERIGAGLAVDKGDARITRAGRILRRLSIDELPQLWNVVRGDMSIIGPRPTLRYQVEQYNDRQRRRLDVKPGITGWAQIRNGYAADHESAIQKLSYDLWYVRHRNLLLDVLICVRTLATVVSGAGAR
jgi:lipopolysaccharide/colanic/teichoic acid biosynthesis glycosyltransferase